MLQAWKVGSKILFGMKLNDSTQIVTWYKECSRKSHGADKITEEMELVRLYVYKLKGHWLKCLTRWHSLPQGSPPYLGQSLGVFWLYSHDLCVLTTWCGWLTEYFLCAVSLMMLVMALVCDFDWCVCAVDDKARGSTIHCYTWSYLLLSCFLQIIIYPACSTFPIQPGLAGKDYTTYIIYIHRFPETPRAEIFVAPCKPFDINTTCDRLLRAWSLCWFQGSCFCWFLCWCSISSWHVADALRVSTDLIWRSSAWNWKLANILATNLRWSD